MENTNMRTVLENIGDATSFDVFANGIIVTVKDIDLTKISDSGLYRLAKMTMFQASAVANINEIAGRDNRYEMENPVHIELKATLKELHEKVIIELLNRAVYSM